MGVLVFEFVDIGVFECMVRMRGYIDVWLYEIVDA